MIDGADFRGQRQAAPLTFGAAEHVADHFVPSYCRLCDSAGAGRRVRPGAGLLAPRGSDPTIESMESLTLHALMTELASLVGRTMSSVTPGLIAEPGVDVRGRDPGRPGPFGAAAGLAARGVAGGGAGAMWSGAPPSSGTGDRSGPSWPGQRGASVGRLSRLWMPGAGRVAAFEFERKDRFGDASVTSRPSRPDASPNRSFRSNSKAATRPAPGIQSRDNRPPTARVPRCQANSVQTESPFHSKVAPRFRRSPGPSSGDSSSRKAGRCPEGSRTTRAPPGPNVNARLPAVDPGVTELIVRPTSDASSVISACRVSDSMLSMVGSLPPGSKQPRPGGRPAARALPAPAESHNLPIGGHK